MTSHKLVFAILITCLYIPQSLASSGDSEEFKDDSHKVKLSLYYEALCPFCTNFIVNNLAKIFENGLISVVDLRLVPWGNAFVKDKKTWVCQHGPDECLLNTVEACAIRVWPDQGAHFSFRFIRCVERLNLENKHSEWSSCFKTEGLNSKPLMDCYNSGLGFQLEQSYADETARLNPPHRFVPWVIVDNLPLEGDYQNFVAYVCREYKGTSVPEACRSPSVEINSVHNEDSIGQVCYANEAKNLTSVTRVKGKQESPRH
ncbi:gamma interferon responsive lysosomal thiol (GILT) reductase family protein [Actinidia rufa]|uniref:Gamma interferon responsive lysosomal thiol (GILT) reductase family protein n=1 Tax=Actinidia rufa TaxID=165716 RepID=A0A7J0DPS9_9ERIC|nr:gamma interferon responsive lysosomal thiol (GILT) reductase family protein [Actinidia rufa]